MSGGRPASLDGSLLARKGDATPAITDESPLVLHLDEHRREPDRPTVASDEIPQSEDNPQNDAPGFTAGARDRLRQASARIRLISPRVRLALIGVAALAVVAIAWPSGQPGNAVAVRTDKAPDAKTAVEVANPNLKLNLTKVPEAFEKQTESADTLESSAATVAMPASVVPAAGDPSDGETAATQTATAGVASTPASGQVLPVNTPANGTPPPVGEVDSTPEILATVPNSVSAIPIPRAKPDVAAVSAGAYAVQLASIANESRANAEAFRLQKRLGHVLGGHEITVEKAVIKGKGTMFRLRAWGFPTYADARAACGQVARLKVDCLALGR